jgi:hypothetical protein
MSYARRAKREAQHQQKKMMLKVHRQFMDRIKGKSTEEVKAIMEQIKLKYGLTDAQPQDEHTILPK